MSQQNENNRRTEIDGLRSLAMIGVLYVHFWDKDPITESIRVSLFFVVSGFLITHILMTARQRGGHIKVLNFYVRRGLRLFPALWIAVTVAYAFDMDGFRGNWLWHALQFSNLYYVLTESWDPWMFSHLWSLNLLEQFYLVWPLVVLFLSRMYVFIIASLSLLICVYIHFFGANHGFNGWWRNIFFVYDPIATGVLTYLIFQSGKCLSSVSSRLTLLLAIILLSSPYFVGNEFGQSPTYRLLTLPALGVIVLGAWNGFGGIIGRALGGREAVLVSKISYGVYIYHFPLWWITAQYFPQLWQPGPTTFVVMTGLSALVATFSWILIERPVSALKKRFPTFVSSKSEDRHET